MARSRNRNNRRNNDNGGLLPGMPTKAILKKQKMASTPKRGGANDVKMSSGEDNDPYPNENIISASCQESPSVQFSCKEFSSV